MLERVMGQKYSSVKTVLLFLGLLLSIVFSLGCFYVAVVEWIQLQKYPSEPTPSTVSGAIDIYRSGKIAYVNISDLVLECSNMLDTRPKGVRAVPATNSEKNIAVVVDFGDRTSCAQDQNATTGTFTPINQRFFEYLLYEGFKFPSVTSKPIWLLDTSEGPIKVTITIVLALVIGLMALRWSYQLIVRLWHTST